MVDEDAEVLLAQPGLVPTPINADRYGELPEPAHPSCC